MTRPTSNTSNIANASRTFDTIVAAPTFSLGIRCDGDDWIEEIAFLSPQKELPGKTPLAMEAARQLHAYLHDPDFVFGLPLKPSGTGFQRRVWQQIAAIPCGQTHTYGDLAKALNNAPRAVGQACGANPFPLAVPCHRVVAANGGLGGFSRQGGGFLLDIKRWLLTHEQQCR
ncbi:MAG: methylated-DNA--[protein]-cysteine S-methyltransferase [Betaproteobacteria bacterium]|uniref:methylated-DNA--[protein]-cysteine S-methyltransferase n=1 Tax=Candidatus Proximibacter danicus TaxID=2954365 RepID=A0A9D7K0W6_9PROT|nr:methylated-DNA--[protein]-cysteine S-methyltransferase [Candidatus Proximibacter danicus]